MQHFEPWHIDKIAATLLCIKGTIGTEEYRELVEEFVDLFTLHNPRFKDVQFRKVCGVPKPFNLIARMPVRRTRKGYGKYE